MQLLVTPKDENHPWLLLMLTTGGSLELRYVVYWFQKFIFPRKKEQKKMNPVSLQKLTEAHNWNALNRALFKVTTECSFQELKPRRLVTFKGYGPEAVRGYKNSLEWLRGRQRTLNYWLKAANRSDVQIAVCSSLTATHTHYGEVLKSLIAYCEKESVKQPKPATLFDVSVVREGMARYVKN